MQVHPCPAHLLQSHELLQLEGIGLRIAKRIDAYLSGIPYVRGWLTPLHLTTSHPLRV